MKDLFKGYKVIELSSVLAGPFAGMLFSELGAEVIKIENKKTGGDVTRGWKTHLENSADKSSAYYSSVNFNKTVLFYDFTQMNEINKTYELLKSADIVITNFKKGDDYKFALDFGRVKTINPSIIYAKIEGFESYPNRTAFDVVAQAECGFMSMNGQATSPPTKMPVAMIDLLAGHQLRTGILTALLKRSKTRKGSLVKVSLERAAISALVNQGTNYLMNGHIPARIGSRHPNIALYGEVFNTKDKKEIVLALGSQKHFELLCYTLHKEELVSNENYSNNQKRLAHLDSLVEELNDAFLAAESQEITLQLEKLGIPFGVVNNLEQVSKSSLAKDMILTENKEGKSSSRFSTVAFQIS